MKEIIKIIRKTLKLFFFLIIYLISTIPVGLLLYSIKTNSNINIFEKTGFHAYQTCLKEQIKLIHVEKTRLNTKNED